MTAWIRTSLVLLILTCSLRLEAQQPDARYLFIRGNEALAAGRRHEALTLFLRSLELARRPSTLLNIAQCYRLLDFPEHAMSYYKRYLTSHADPSVPIPYLAEVQGHVSRLQVQRDLLVEARQHQREGAHAAAIEQLRLAQQLTRWPGLGLLLARSHLALHDDALALRYARSALSAYAFHLRQWREAGAPPQHVTKGADAARRLVQRLETSRTAAAAPPQPPKTKKTKNKKKSPARSRVWLVTAIAAGALALAAEVTALVYYRRANQLRTDDPDFDKCKSITIAGHVSAGALALISGISIYIALSPPEPSQGTPRTRALVTATFRF